jgi:hypothetical protein
MFFVNSGTEEEANLLAAHLGIFDAHVVDWEDCMMEESLDAWEAEYSDFCENEFPNGEFPFGADTQRNRNGWGF